MNVTTFQPRRPIGEPRTLDDLRAVADYIGTLWRDRCSAHPGTLALLEEELRRYIADHASHQETEDA